MDTDFPLLLVADNLAFPNLNFVYQLQKNVAVKGFNVPILPYGFKPRMYVTLLGLEAVYLFRESLRLFRFRPPFHLVLADKSGTDIFRDITLYFVLI